MDCPKHSDAAINAHPAPAIGSGAQYARECLKVHEARIKFDIIERVMAEVSEGTTLRSMCREQNMPTFSTIYTWINADAELITRFARARETGFDCISEQILDIVDDSSSDTYTDSEGNERTNTEVVQRSKLRAETRLKLLA